jgi:hypothetical protein
MNNHSNNEGHPKLIHRALADENWTAFDAQLRDRALQTFAGAKRRRHFAFLTAQAAAILVVVGALALVLAHHSRPMPASESTLAADVERAGSSLPNTITEEQMLAMFPRGSCLVAEINGQRRLVFLDPRAASEGFPIQAQPRSAHN